MLLFQDISLGGEAWMAGLVRGVSTFLKLWKGVEIDSLVNVPKTSEWLLNIGCLLAINFEHYILVNVYFPYSNLSNEVFMKSLQRGDYEIHEYLVKL